MSSNKLLVPPSPMPKRVLATVLIGFPLLFFLHSLILLDRERFTVPGIDFFLSFWAATTLIYAAKIGVIGWLLRRQSWGWSDIGLVFNRRSAVRWLVGYGLVAACAIAGVEWLAAQTRFDEAALKSLPGLYPRETALRVMLVVMGLVAGLSEEITYRGFAIQGFISQGVPRWIAPLLAVVPFIFQHGIKSLDQFWWFLGNGLFLGLLFVAVKRVWPGLVIHWLIIGSALMGVFAARVA